MRHPALNEASEVSAAQRAEILARVDAAVAALPERYRRVLVLCYLEGASQSEAAERLRLSPGMVAARCSRGLERLRARLSIAEDRRLRASALGALLLGEAARAAQAFSLKPALSSALAASKGAAAGAAVDAPVMAVVDGAMKIIFWQKLKLATGLVIAALALGAAALLVWKLAAGGVPEEPRPNHPSVRAKG